MASIDLPGDVDGTFTVGVGTISLDSSASVLRQPLTFALELQVTAVVGVPLSAAPTPRLRTQMGVHLIVPAPTLAGGRPYMPRWPGVSDSTLSVITGPDHLRVFNDPDPVWSGPGWLVPPPSSPSGSSFVRWTTTTLPDPNTYGEYHLGTPDARDGSLSLPSAAHQWDSAPGSDVAMAWQSGYPFKPLVRNHDHFGPHGDYFLGKRAVRFAPQWVYHMWLDAGAFFTPPFTIVVVGIVVDFSGPTTVHRVLDAGGDPRQLLPAAMFDSWFASGVDNDYPIAPEYLLNARTGLQVGPYHTLGFNDQVPSTRIAWVPFSHTYSPKMLAYTVNGSGSMVASYSGGVKYLRRITFANHGAQRQIVLGRGRGIVSPRWASHLSVFEIRGWNRALSESDLDAQFRQLSSTWQFSQYVGWQGGRV